jgi:tagatose 1,6-diphosphate aldolase
MNKADSLRACSRRNGVIAALAIDQRNSLLKALARVAGGTREFGDADLRAFKALVAKALTPYASGVLLDPLYGLVAAQDRTPGTGLILAYEASGYDTTVKGRFPDLAETWSVRRLAEQGANAVKLLVYYNPVDAAQINDVKHAFVERVGAECAAEGLPLFLEPLTYHDELGGEGLTRAKPQLVRETAREFSKARYRVDVLKLEFPIDPLSTEGLGTASSFVLTREEAVEAFQALDEAATVPYIFLSAGVDMGTFARTLEFAVQSRAGFSGVLCGRATWKGAIDVYATRGAEAAEAWLHDEGVRNISDLNRVLELLEPLR